MLSLDKRSCLIGNRRGNFSLTGIMLEGHELNYLLDDEGAWNTWFKVRPDGLPAPATSIKPVRRISAAQKFQNSQATLYVGAHAPVSLQDLEISRATLTPKVGGLTELSITCVSTPAMPVIDDGDELAHVQLDIRTDRETANPTRSSGTLSP